MFNVSIKFDPSATIASFKKTEKDLAKELQKAVKDTTIASARQLKEWRLPKRSGMLRKSYNFSQINSLVWIVKSDSKYADAIEFGQTSRKEVRPTNGHKFLTIPLRDDVLTGTRAQIRKSALNVLFDEVGYNPRAGKLYSKVKDKSVSDVFEDVGIALARKVKPGPIKAQNNIKTYMPKVDRMLQENVDLAIKRVLAA